MQSFDLDSLMQKTKYEALYSILQGSGETMPESDGDDTAPTPVQQSDDTATTPLRLAACLMVKDEERTVLTTLESVKGLVDAVVVFDTGSTDGTVDVIKQFCTSKGLALHFIEGVFTDFAESRNVLLDFADSVLPRNTYLLLLDSNDQVVENGLRDAMAAAPPHSQGFQLQQRWELPDGTTDTFYNTRMVRAHCGWRYEAPVHEFLVKITETPLDADVPEEVYWYIPDKLENLEGCERIYSVDAVEKRERVSAQPVRISADAVQIHHVRAHDIEKTLKRHKWDIQVLESSLLRDPVNTRTQFYLAQSYAMDMQLAMAAKLYERRSLQPGKMREEQFHAALRRGDLAVMMADLTKTIVYWYTEAYMISTAIGLGRAEPLVRLAELYTSLGNIEMAWMYAQAAVSARDPYVVYGLFVSESCYTHRRFHVGAVVAFKMYERFKDAACLGIAAKWQAVASASPHAIPADAVNLAGITAAERRAAS